MPKKKGTIGEEAAEAFLRSRDYRIVARNFRSSRGEVDIIASRDECLVFVEVKTWDSLADSALEHAVGRRKQQRIVATARYFLSRNPQWADAAVRFDVILLRDNLKRVVHIENAFGA